MMPVRREQLPFGIRLVSEGATIEVIRRGANAVLVTVIGDVTEEFEESYRDALRESTRGRGGLELFLDQQRAQNLPVRLREDVLELVRELGKRGTTVHVLSESRSRPLLLATVNMVLGGRLHRYPDRGSFESALRAASATDKP